MIEEVEALGEHGTYELVDLPAHARAVSGKWVFKIKRGPTGEISDTKRDMLLGALLRKKG